MRSAHTTPSLLNAVLFLSPDDERDLQAHKALLAALRRQRHQPRPIQWHIVYNLLPSAYYAYSINRTYAEDLAYGETLLGHAAQLLKRANQPRPMTYCYENSQDQALKGLSSEVGIDFYLGHTGVRRIIKGRLRRRLHRLKRWPKRGQTAFKTSLPSAKWFTLQWLKA